MTKKRKKEKERKAKEWEKKKKDASELFPLVNLSRPLNPTHL